jgi:hypothetical protein
MRVRADRLASELAAAQDSGALAAQTHSEALTKVRERTDDGYDIHHDGDGDDIHHGGYAIHHGGYDIHHVAMIYTMVVMIYTTVAILMVTVMSGDMPLWIPCARGQTGPDDSSRPCVHARAAVLCCAVRAGRACRLRRRSARRRRRAGRRRRDRRAWSGWRSLGARTWRGRPSRRCVRGYWVAVGATTAGARWRAATTATQSPASPGSGSLLGERFSDGMGRRGGLGTTAGRRR